MAKTSFYRKLDKSFQVLGIFCILFGLFILLVLVLDVFSDGKSRLNWGFLTSIPSRKAEKAGILSAWVGTIWIMFTTAFAAIPLGIGSGIYLEEYAKKNRFTDFILQPIF